MTSEALLDRAQLRQAFDLLAKRLAHRHVVGEVHIFGGAAMTMVYDGRGATRDVDALFSPDGPMLAAVREVAAELGLPSSWMNNQASSYVSGRAGRGIAVYEHANLRVMATPPEHLLAMKARAARSFRDADDLRILLRALHLTSYDEVVEIVERYFPDEPLSERSRLFVEDVLNTLP